MSFVREFGYIVIDANFFSVNYFGPDFVPDQISVLVPDQMSVFRSTITMVLHPILVVFRHRERFLGNKYFNSARRRLTRRGYFSRCVPFMWWFCG